jgi:hypothetical protein
LSQIFSVLAQVAAVSSDVTLILPDICPILDNLIMARAVAPVVA